jgi:hypothetical protein
VDESALVDSVGFRAGIRARGKASHRGHRGGIGVGGRESFGGQRWLLCGNTRKGKHRTEVTEATEGDWGWWTRELWWKALGSVREYAQRESIARRLRRGLDFWGEINL